MCHAMTIVIKKVLNQYRKNLHSSVYVCNSHIHVSSILGTVNLQISIVILDFRP